MKQFLILALWQFFDVTCYCGMEFYVQYRIFFFFLILRPPSSNFGSPHHWVGRADDVEAVEIVGLDEVRHPVGLHPTLRVGPREEAEGEEAHIELGGTPHQASPDGLLGVVPSEPVCQHVALKMTGI